MAFDIRGVLPHFIRMLVEYLGPSAPYRPGSYLFRLELQMLRPKITSVLFGDGNQSHFDHSRHRDFIFYVLLDLDFVHAANFEG